ncbi:MAG: hypothetical protein FWC36_02890 [Spirochaetes bacterium]|nr:hypothetical protein [Spirochaetota bacterium]
MDAQEIKQDIWFKFMANIGINQIPALLDADYGFIQKNSYAKKLMENAMLEVIDIANAKGVHLTESDINKWHTILNSLAPKEKTLMRLDMEMLSYKIIELGSKYNIDVTVNKVLYNLIKAKEDLFSAN